MITSVVDIVNQALQYVGTRTTVDAAELVAESSNEAIQANLTIYRLRDELLRMAPWNCAFNAANLTYITSVPGTPENTSPATTLWQKGQPMPPWAYEYQYPIDCLRPCWIIPASQTGYAGGVPITTAVTGGAAVSWSPPIRYKVGTDQFFTISAAAIVSGGVAFNPNDQIILAGNAAGAAPIGAPAVIRVLTVNGAGTILTCEIINSINSPVGVPKGGSYFYVQSNPVAQGSSSSIAFNNVPGTGTGSGATFNITFAQPSNQRVILTNQEFATLAYIKQITDPNVMDELFLDAWCAILGSRLCLSLTGDKSLAKDLANIAVNAANSKIAEARKADGNEGLTINDVTPDWIRIRGVNFTEYLSGPYAFDWGPMFSTF